LERLKFSSREWQKAKGRECRACRGRIDVSPTDSSVDIVISLAAAGKGGQKESSEPKKTCDYCRKLHPKSSFSPAGWQGRGWCQMCRNRYAKISLSRARALSLGLCVLVTQGSVGLGRLRERDREKNKARQSVARLSSIQLDTPADPNSSTLPPTACVGGGRGATRLAVVAAVGSQRVNTLLCMTTDVSASTSSHATADTHLEGKESERQNEPTKTCDNCRKLGPISAVCCRMLTYTDVCVCGRILTYANVCLRLLQETAPQVGFLSHRLAGPGVVPDVPSHLQ
jgi:hypothetical protein